MCSVLRDKRRVKQRCVALLILVPGKHGCGPLRKPHVGQLPWGSCNKPGEVD